MTDGTRRSGTTAILSDVLNHVSSLIRKEVDLARAEVNENINRAGAAIGLLVAAVIFALVALNVLAAALVAAVAEMGLETGWASLIVGVAFALLAFGMMWKGLNDLKLSSLAPTRMVKNVRRDAEAVKESIE